MRLQRRRPSEHLGRDNRILGSPAGEDALLQVDSIDPMAPEDVVAAILQDPPDAVEIPVPLHPGQGHMGLPRASLRREFERLERALQGRRDSGDGPCAIDTDPDHVHPGEARERPGPPDGDVERPDLCAGLADCRHDFGDEPLFRVAEELHREMELVRGDDLERSARGPQLIGEAFERGRRGDVDRDEPSERHGPWPPGPRPFVSATNRPRSSNRPRRWPSRTAVRKMFVATSRETESSAARSWTSIVPRAVAYAAPCTSARSRALSLRAYPRKYRPGMRKRNAHSVAAATLTSCWSTAPAAARMPPTPARASETVPSRSYKVRRFTRTPSRQSTTRVPRNGWPRVADRSAGGSRPWTTLNGVRSRATTRAATGSNTMLGPAASWPFPARSMRSRKLMRSSNRAFGSFRGSVVYTPATEVAFTMRAAWTNRASDALTRSVVWPGRVPAMMTIGYRRASFAASA